jgi:hypothetical protein
MARRGLTLYLDPYHRPGDGEGAPDAELLRVVTTAPLSGLKARRGHRLARSPARATWVSSSVSASCPMGSEAL